MPDRAGSGGADAAGSDLDLLRRTGDGDQQAYNTLFRRFYPRLCQFVAKMSPQHDLVDEVVGDTLFIVWRDARRFRGLSKVSTWVFGIAHRQCLKALDKQRRRGFVTAQDQLLDALPADNTASDPALTSIDERRWREAQQAIAGLNPDAKATVYLVAMGHSYADVATIMRCPENTVKTRMFNARRQLQKQLRAEAKDSTQPALQS